MNIRRILLRAVTLAMATVLLATPALAHECYKTGWNATAYEKNAGQAWVTAEFWLGMLAMVPDSAPQECLDAVAAAEAEINALNDGTTLFMGPGALAGIDRHAGGREGAKRPAHMGRQLIARRVRELRAAGVGSAQPNGRGQAAPPVSCSRLSADRGRRMRDSRAGLRGVAMLNIHQLWRWRQTCPNLPCP